MFRRLGSRAWASLGALALVAAPAVVAWDCLPDLEITQPPPAPLFCGDGTIDPDAGEECDPGDATTLGCQACKVQCSSPSSSVAFVDPASHHCYFSVGLLSNLTTLSEPQCEAQGAHVVRFVSNAEMSLVATNAPTTDIWVGMMHDAAAAPSEYAPIPSTSIEPAWSPTCSGCYAYVDAGATEIPGAQADNCVEVPQGLSEPWSTSACLGAKGTFLRETICEREPVGSRATFCSEAVCFTVAATASAKRYVLVPQKTSAGEAVTTCQGYGGRLAVFGSREEREQVAYEVANQSIAAPVADYWIGLTTIANGAWAWDDAGVGVAPDDVLGEGQATPEGGAGVRAFALIAPGTVDSELARAELAGAAHDPLCEITF